MNQRYIDRVLDIIKENNSILSQIQSLGSGHIITDEERTLLYSLEELSGSWELGDYFEYDSVSNTIRIIGANLSADGGIKAFSDSYDSTTWWDDMPLATSTSIGGIKLGSDFSLNASGQLQYSGTSGLDEYPPAGIVVSTGTDWGASIIDNSANWNTAYGWGDHAGLYSLLGHNHSGTYWEIEAGANATELPISWNGADSRWEFTGKLYVTDDLTSAGQVASFVSGIDLGTWWDEMPLATSTAKGGIKLGSDFELNLDGQLQYTGTTGSVSVWGDIGGTLSDQTDLQNALDAKENEITPGTTSQYWRGDKTWRTLLGETSSTAYRGDRGKTAYDERRQWNGGATNLVASTGRASLGLGTAATKAETYFGRLASVNTWTQNNYFNDSVGIGTTTPAAKLHILNDSYESFRIERDSVGALGMYFYNASGKLGQVGSEANGSLWLRPSASAGGSTLSGLWIGNDNYNGIGTTSPLSPLHVNGNGPTLRLQRSSSGSPLDGTWHIFPSANSTPYSSDHALRFNHVDGTAIINFDSDGSICTDGGGYFTGTVAVGNATAATHAMNRQTGDGRWGRLDAENEWTEENIWKKTGNSYLRADYSIGNGMFFFGYDNETTPAQAFLLRTYAISGVQLTLDKGGISVAGEVTAYAS